ncbi:MAG TPA: phosphoglucosamine mutase [Terriglobales bacterium]|nr:phosphoglucosamine mutase [Terriglobales bacterium]
MSGGARRLFGTDGIRGVAGEFPLDNDTVLLIGRVLGRRLAAGDLHPRVVLGQDTRASSARLADTLARGMAEPGVEVESAGIVSTPAVAYLARQRSYRAGIVISASHNPWTDNGIKVFGHDGYKLPDQVELEIEGEIFSRLAEPQRADAEPASPLKVRASLPGDPALKQAYEDWLCGRVDLGGARRLKVVVDCANGAASALAPEVLARSGLPVQAINVSPDGQNINDHCGALHPEVVAKAAKERRADLGISFDGDADRALFADHEGKVVNGDAVLLLAARAMQSRGALRNDTVVATTMSNMGLEAALGRSGIRMLRAPVGDKYVLEEMRKSGAVLGGEQSGHILFLDQATTGDGLLTALRVLEIVGQSGKPLAELVADLKVFPQTIQNVRVREKRPLEEVEAVRRAIEEAERQLGSKGRVVVRYSGTEPLARVMVEAGSEAAMRAHAHAIAEAIRNALGA